MKELTKTKVVKMLMNECYSLPEAVKIYNMLSCNGMYPVTKEEVKQYIG